MAIHSRTNLYPGINPHLNNYLQYETGWAGFHKLHLDDIFNELETILPDEYFTATEQSLQIGIYDAYIDDKPLTKPSLSRPDISIYRDSELSDESPLASPLFASAEQSKVVDTFIETKPDIFVSSAIIYKLIDGSLPGQPITRIELLSPANKPPGQGYAQYVEKRQETLKSGLRLVEIDYLHARRTIYRDVPIYPSQENAKPYVIGVNDPRPDLLNGNTYFFRFGVVDKIPSIPIPLDGNDIVELDFPKLYNKTFLRSRLFQKLVDYTQEPLHMDSFTPADQQAIRDTMAHIAKTHEQ